MASSGTVNLNLESVDLTGPCGQCYEWNPSCNWGRGGNSYTAPFSWYVSDGGVLSVSFNGGSTWWWVASQTDAYYLKVQFSTDGNNWSDVLSASEWHTTQIYVNTLISNLTSNLGTATLSRSGYIRIYSYTGSACPTSDAPNAYPTEAASQAVSVPVYIEVDWDAKLQYDATGGSGAPATQTRTVSASTTSTNFTVSNTIPTKANHRFDGWIYGGNIYHGGDTFTVYKSTPTVTLKAVWTEYYRPGTTLYATNEYGSAENKVWYSNHKTNGACHIRTENNTWKEMRTIDGASNGQGDPPLIYRNDSLYNQKKLGKT